MGRDGKNTAWRKPNIIISPWFETLLIIHAKLRLQYTTVLAPAYVASYKIEITKCDLRFPFISQVDSRLVLVFNETLFNHGDD